MLKTMCAKDLDLRRFRLGIIALSGQRPAVLPKAAAWANALLLPQMAFTCDASSFDRTLLRLLTRSFGQKVLFNKENQFGRPVRQPAVK